MVALIIILSFLFTGCDDIIGSNNVVELDDVVLTILATEAQPYHWEVSGIAVNTGDTTILAPWYIEAMFYSDNTYTETFGGGSDRINFSLEPGVTTYWTLTHSIENVIESNYPNFTIKDLRAYIQR